MDLKLNGRLVKKKKTRNFNAENPVTIEDRRWKLATHSHCGTMMEVQVQYSIPSQRYSQAEFTNQIM